MEFKDMLKKARLQAMLSQQEMAKELGVSFSSLNRWEAGVRKPNYAGQRAFKNFCDSHEIYFSEEINVGAKKWFMPNDTDAAYAANSVTKISSMVTNYRKLISVACLLKIRSYWPTWPNYPSYYPSFCWLTVFTGISGIKQRQMKLIVRSMILIVILMILIVILMLILMILMKEIRQMA